MKNPPPFYSTVLVSDERLKHSEKHGKSIQLDHENYPSDMLTVFAEAVLNLHSFPVHIDPAYIEKIKDTPWKQRLIIAASLLCAQIDVINYRERWRSFAEEKPKPDQFIEMQGLELPNATECRYNHEFDMGSEDVNYHWRPIDEADIL